MTCRSCTATMSAPGWPAAGGTQILMLTAAGSLSDLVDGLNLGADDYQAKPFHFPELVARVHALSRRAASARRCCAAASWPWTGPGAGPAGTGSWCR